MNNLEAWDYLSSKESIGVAVIDFVEKFQLEECEVDSLRYKYRILKSSRDSSRKSKLMKEWENELFYTFPSTRPLKKRIQNEKINRRIRFIY